MKRLVAPALIFAVLAACSPPPRTDVIARVEAVDGLCRPTPNGRDVTGCYITLTSSRDDRLVSVSSPSAAEAQIHEMSTANGVMSMRELPDGLPLPAGEAVRLQPGGDHLMLYGLNGPLAVGDEISVTLTFQHAQPLGARFRVAHPPVGGQGGQGH